MRDQLLGLPVLLPGLAWLRHVKPPGKQRCGWRRNRLQLQRMPRSLAKPAPVWYENEGLETYHSPFEAAVVGTWEHSIGHY